MKKTIFTITMFLVMLLSVISVAVSGDNIQKQEELEPFVYHFIEGWNLITLPLIVENSSIETLFAGLNCLQFYYYWNASQQMYELVDTLIPGYGYWMYVYETVNYTIYGHMITEDLSIDIVPPKNIIGWVHNLTITAKDIYETIPECQSVSIPLNATQDTYLTYNASEPENNFNITQGMGFWVEVNTSSTWNGSIYKPEPEIEVKIKRGFGYNVTVLIRNVGELDAVAVEYNISVAGGMLGYINKSVDGIIPIIEAGNETSIDIQVFGLGRIRVNATADTANEKAVGFVFLGFVYIPYILNWTP